MASAAHQTPSTPIFDRCSPTPMLTGAPVPPLFLIAGDDLLGGDTVTETRAANDAAMYPRTPIARCSDGSFYAGNLLAHILEYRELRSKMLQRACTGGREFGRLATLESRLRQPEDATGEGAHLRHYYRFDCRFPATFGLHDGLGRHGVMVEDISAGGVKIRLGWDVDPGTATWLQTEIETDGERTRVMFPARVAWSRNGEIGLMFAGAPVYGA